MSKENFDHKGWLTSNSFFKRVLAVGGYQFMFSLFLYGCIFLVYLIFISMGVVE